MKNTDYYLLPVKKMLLSLILCISLSACGGLEDKSVTEPLTKEQQQKLIAKDLDYILVCGMVKYVEDEGIFLSPEVRKNLKPLSYRRLKDFISKWTDEENRKKTKAKYESQWDDMFDSNIPKVDAISDHWLEFLEDYKPENYLKVELVDIIDKSEVFVGYVQVKLRLTPLKGTISDVNLLYGLEGSMMGRNSLSHSESFSSPIVEQASMHFYYVYDIDASKVNSLPIEELLKEYPFETRIESFVADGRTIDYLDGYFKVPDCVRSFWSKGPVKGKDWKSDYEREECYEKVMRELVDTTMTSKFSYVQDNMRKEAYEDDELAATFYYQLTDNH